LFPDHLIDRVAGAKSMVVITGAGVSAESGVPTFRGKNGLWKRYRAEDLATPRAFDRDPVLVWEWYDWRRGLILGSEPNPGHLALAELEKGVPDFLLLTQNVDGLHQRAGSRRIVEIHGSLWRLRCPTEGKVSENYEVPLSELPPRCSCGAILRPDVVWFGESLDGGTLQRAYSALEGSECVLVTGTSGVVQPVASFPLIAKKAGAFVIGINRETTPLSPLMDESFQGKAGEILPALLAAVKAGGVLRF
jgi:NAD-dependent deacetylase